EEAGVEQRVNEQREEHRACGDPERAVAARDEVEEPARAREQRGIDDEAEQAELCGNGERRRVRAVAFRGELGVGLVPARLWLPAYSDPDERMHREDHPGQACEARASARR